MSIFDEYRRIIKHDTLHLTGEFITKKNNKIAIKVDIQKNKGSYNITPKEQLTRFEIINILWIAGLISPKNWNIICDKIDNKITSKSQNRAIALGLDTSLLLINQVTPLINTIVKKQQKSTNLERNPIIVTTQATQYEIHHQISSELRKKFYLKDKIESFYLPSKNYNARGRRGVWGRFLHQTIVERFPHILVQTKIPNMLTKINNEDKEFSLADVTPTSPVFDNVIFEQFRELASLTNLEILFTTTDSNLARISEQSGIFSLYLEQPTELPNNVTLKQRDILWIFLTMLYKYDKVTIQGETTEEWMLVKNSRGSLANIYFKKNNNKRNFYELKVDDKVF